MPFTPKRKASTGLNKLACIEVRIPPARLERYNTILQSTPPIARNVEDFIAVLQDTIRQQCSEQEQLKSRIRRLEYERVKACRDSEAYYQRLLTSHEQVNKDVDELQRHHEALLREQERAAIQLSDLHSKLNASSTKSAQSEVEKTRLQKLFDAEQQVVTELRERLDQAHAAEALIQPSSTNTGSSTSPRQFTESHCTNNDTLSVAKMDLTRCVQSFESLEFQFNKRKADITTHLEDISNSAGMKRETKQIHKSLNAVARALDFCREHMSQLSQLEEAVSSDSDQGEGEGSSCEDDKLKQTPDKSGRAIDASRKRRGTQPSGDQRKRRCF